MLRQLIGTKDQFARLDVRSNASQDNGIREQNDPYYFF